MRENSKTKKIIAMLFIALTLFGVFGSYVSAEINKQYYEKSIRGITVVENELEDDGKLLPLLARMANTVGSLLEWLVGSIFASATGTNMFPWADVVVFNAVPLLDPNFINPDPNSFLAKIGGNITKLYGTIFGMGVAFFGVAIMITSLKLVTSTIAEKKASYKKAIVNWLLGLVLLFGIHFFMSFVFYLNEQLVIMASEMVDITDEVQTIQYVPFTDEQLVQNFIDAMKTVTISELLFGILSLSLTRLESLSNKLQLQLFYNMSVEEGELIVKKYANVAAALLKIDDFTSIVFQQPNFWGMWQHTSTDQAFFAWSEGGPETIAALATHVRVVVAAPIEALEQGLINSYESQDYDSVDRELLKIYINVKKEVLLKKPSTVSLMSNLGQYFKSSVHTFGDKSWKATNVVAQNAFLYATFVVQSVIFLVAYMKRLFYIVILGIMAPIVVVFDYMKKTQI